MSHPIKKMPANYEVKEVNYFRPRQFDAIVVCNYCVIKEVSTYAMLYNRLPFLIDEYTTAIFRIKWKT